MVEKEAQLRPLAKLYMAAHFQRLVQALQQHGCSLSTFGTGASTTWLLTFHVWYRRFNRLVNEIKLPQLVK
jgi:hypothetical protein